MYAQKEKSKENRSKAVVNTVAQKRSNFKQGFGPVDNRQDKEKFGSMKQNFSNLPRVNQLEGVNQHISFNTFAPNNYVVQKVDDSLEEDGDTHEDMSDTAFDVANETIIYEGGGAIQLARKPDAWSGPKDVGGHKDLWYFRDGGGNIDFQTPLNNHGSKDDDKSSMKASKHTALDTFTKGGALVDLGTVYDTKNRTEHFKRANTICNNKGIKVNGGLFPIAGVSPDNWTWHHLSAKYRMILVNREAHRRFGHNGGVHIW
ncbi:HNH endonuclease [Pseudoalteromonas aurantia]|uniref:Uncharacterized protein n=1 Tax=Pseudoalteromonas aurantia 208 TaxID=1314867 RepID=A0ABR9EH32_9GAMM|nr:HNH endonuclease [Pseudoalteromonas aurantia]MBE0370304.1 hypothetical protein [Pseudoalteromonas aurantia 208]